MAAGSLAPGFILRELGQTAFEGWEPAARRAFSVGLREDYSSTQPF
jgi:hypothetical protein